MAKQKLFVHVKNDGRQVFYKGDKLEIDEGLAMIYRSEDLVAVISFQPGESIGEYFDVTKENKELS